MFEGVTVIVVIRSKGYFWVSAEPRVNGGVRDERNETGLALVLYTQTMSVSNNYCMSI